MGNKHSASAAITMAGVKSQAKSFVNDVKSDSKMNKMKKAPPSNRRERNKRHKEREKEFVQVKKERDEKKLSMKQQWAKNRVALDSKKEGGALKALTGKNSFGGGNNQNKDEKNGSSTWWASGN